MTSATAEQRKARLERDANQARRRLRERECAWLFLHEDELDHAETCVFDAGARCSRTYRAGPEPDKDLYEGTGIGALFGWGPQHAWQLAGWNVVVGEIVE